MFPFCSLFYEKMDCTKDTANINVQEKTFISPEQDLLNRVWAPILYFKVPDILKTSSAKFTVLKHICFFKALLNLI